MTRENETGYSIDYEFDYKGHHENYDYELSFDELMKAIRKYFDDQLVVLDGTDTNVWNALISLGRDAIDMIVEEESEFLKKECEEVAFEEFKDYVDYYYEEEDFEEEE